MHDLKLNRSASYYANKYKIYIAFLVIFIIGIIFAPNFLNAFNINALLKTANLYGMLAIGFSIVMICGHLDLSIQVVMNLGAVLSMGIFVDTDLGWPISIFLAIGAGALIGLFNGILVTRFKIHSFIVTLGTMTMVNGMIFLYTKSGSISLQGDFEVSDAILKEVVPLFPPITIITLVAVVLMSIIMAKTRFGKNYYMVGGNPETAWLAGIKKDAKIIVAFAMCSGFASLAGTLFSIAQGSAVPNMGEKGVSPLMVTIAAVIIGGISMSGGKGDIVRSYFGVLTIVTLFNVLSCFGTGYEAQIFAVGLVLAAIVLYEALSEFIQNKYKGIRKELLAERKRVETNLIR